MMNPKMTMKVIFTLFIILAPSISLSGTVRHSLNPLNGACLEEYEFRCLDGYCIPRHQHCNGQRDCSDSSDENYCDINRYQSCPEIYSFLRCSDKCVPSVWKCDGFRDCSNGADEQDCDTGRLDSSILDSQCVKRARARAKTWLYNHLKNGSSTNRWGIQLKKITVALYLGEHVLALSNETQIEMAYELSVQLLSKFAFRQLSDVSTDDLASYTNALIVTCLDPRKFHSVNLVQELRSRVDKQNYTNPYTLLTLCNAGETITQRDMQKLNQSFWYAHRQFWTETQAIAVMALACAGNQPESDFDVEELKDFTLQLKKRQFRNGTVEDLKTTALVLQAIYSSEPEEDSENFEEERALLQILREQQADGSFGNIVNTYYVLPILAYKTLVNISSNHCQPYIKDEDSALEDIMNQVGPKMRVRYSLWTGNNRDLERTMKLRVPNNISFYGIMEMAGDVDPQFRFQYVVKNRKPYVNAISEKQDDPESGKFWFLYSVQDSKPVPVLKSKVRQLIKPSYVPCREDEEFRCLNGRCIPRYQYCNGRTDCSDSSDEQYCSSRSCSTTYPFYYCKDGKCIPFVWRCDGNRDCRYGDDESDCETIGFNSTTLDSQSVILARKRARMWLFNQLKTGSSTNRWGTHLRKISVALYLGEPLLTLYNETRIEMPYELSIQLLSKFAFRQLSDVSTDDLASFTNALVVTCLDPRKFHSVNLVEELRSRADKQNYTSPYTLLTLCNAGETITQRDIQKLNQTFWNAHRQFWTGTQAIAVMAFACAGNQPESSFDVEELKDFTLQLKKRQYRNGTVEDLKTTALVLQAIYSTEPKEDSENFEEERALLQILREQQADGSFGNLVNTYYVLPILAYKTLVNISSNHCKPYIKDDCALEDIMNQVGPKMRIRYSLWIGNNRDLERTMKLRVPNNISFYGVMEMAGDVDPKFKFQYVVKNNKPYVNAISGKQDDPESEKFWFLYNVQNSKPFPVKKSPADFFPKDNDHVIMWYRSGSWIE